jgi:serine/threonine protein kinase
MAMNKACRQHLGKQESAEVRLRAEVCALFGRRPRASLPPPLPRTVSHYKLLRGIGAGSKGEVYLAQSHQRVAIKIMRPYADLETRRRFLREAECGSALRHPNVVAIYDLILDGPRDYLVMEYVPGKTLDRVIPKRGFPLNTCLAYALQIAEAVSAMHSALGSFTAISSPPILPSPARASSSCSISGWPR